MNERSSQKRLRPRKTPTQSRSEETVASIVQAAAQILETDFPGKDALTVALIRRETYRYAARMAVPVLQPAIALGLDRKGSCGS
jgi:hypothetical protein